MVRLLATMAGLGLWLLGSTVVVYLLALLDHETTSLYVTEPKVLRFEDRRRRRASRLSA